MAVLGLRFCARAFSSCGKRGPLFIAVRGPLTIAASLVAEHRLQTRRLSNCGSRAQLLRGTWDPPRPGLEPMSPALAGRLSTTAPPGKPPRGFLCTFKFKKRRSSRLYPRLLLWLQSSLSSHHHYTCKVRVTGSTVNEKQTSRPQLEHGDSFWLSHTFPSWPCVRKSYWELEGRVL